MDRQQVLERLKQCEDHVTRGEGILTHQREIVAHFEADGHDASMAKRLLAAFEEVHAVSITHRDRLQRMLNE